MTEPCRDKRFEKMLYSLELDILSDSDREALEVHLIECESCYEKACRFETAVNHLRRDPEVRREVESLAPAHSGSGGGWSRGFLKLLPAVAAVLILALLVAGPWRPGVGPGDELVAASNRVVVMYFDDLTPPDTSDNLGEIIASLLITDLGESRYVQVVSVQRLHDLQRLLNLDTERSITADEATAIARRSGAQWMLTGAIVRRSPLLLTSQIAEIKSGDVIATQRIEGKPGDDVFSLVDRLTVQVKNDLALPSEALDEPDRHVADYTTGSREAYRYYLQGLSNTEKVYDRAAREAFRKAIECDSTFAMAYYYLSLLGEPTLISRAIRYIDHTSTPDRYRIRSHEAMLFADTASAIQTLQEAVDRYPDEKDLLIQLAALLSYMHRYNESIAMFERALEVDPLSKQALNRLAYTAMMAKRYDLAEETVNRYIRIDSNQANPYDTQGDILSAQNRLYEANESYRKALAVDPNFSASLVHLARNLILVGNYVGAEEVIGKLRALDNQGLVTQGNLYQAILAVRQGDLDQAAKELRDGAAYDLQHRIEFNLSFKRFLLAQIISRSGSYNEAIQIVESCPLSIDSVQPDPVIGYRHIAAQYAAQAGDFDRAHEIVAQLAASPSPHARFGELYARGAIALFEGNQETAVSLLTEADSLYDNSSTGYLLARAYLKAGDYARAANMYEELLSSPAYRWHLWAVWEIESIYYSGLAYEGAGDYDQAATAYEDFLSLWGNASPPAPEADDARSRLARLRSRP